MEISWNVNTVLTELKDEPVFSGIIPTKGYQYAIGKFFFDPEKLICGYLVVSNEDLSGQGSIWLLVYNKSQDKFIFTLCVASIIIIGLWKCYRMLRS